MGLIPSHHHQPFWIWSVELKTEEEETLNAGELEVETSDSALSGVIFCACDPVFLK